MEEKFLRKEDLLTLVRSLVSETMPAELSHYDRDAPDLLDYIMQEGALPPEPQDDSDSGFVTEVWQAVGFVVALWGTYKTLKEIYGKTKKILSPRDPSAPSLPQRWEAELIAAGMSENLAKQIVESFSEDLIRLVSKT